MGTLAGEAKGSHFISGAVPAPGYSGWGAGTAWALASRWLGVGEKGWLVLQMCRGGRLYRCPRVQWASGDGVSFAR